MAVGAAAAAAITAAAGTTTTSTTSTATTAITASSNHASFASARPSRPWSSVNAALTVAIQSPAAPLRPVVPHGSSSTSLLAIMSEPEHALFAPQDLQVHDVDDEFDLHRGVVLVRVLDEGVELLPVGVEDGREPRDALPHVLELLNIVPLRVCHLGGELHSRLHAGIRPRGEHGHEDAQRLEHKRLGLWRRSMQQVVVYPQDDLARRALIHTDVRAHSHERQVLARPVGASQMPADERCERANVAFTQARTIVLDKEARQLQ
jgi:hypothetical protein